MADIKFPPPGRAGVFVPPTMPAKTATSELKISAADKAKASTFWENQSKATGLKVGATADDMRNGTALRPKDNGGFFGGLLGGIVNLAVGAFTGGIGNAVSGWAGGLASSIFGKK
jgi:hypothetical protein